MIEICRKLDKSNTFFIQLSIYFYHTVRFTINLSFQHYTYRDRIKQYRQNNEKIYQQREGECMNTYQQTDGKKTKQFWNKIWQLRENNRKAEWIRNMGKELERLKEGPKAKIQLVSFRATLKEIGKRQAMMAYMDTGLKIHFHPRQTGYRNE